MAEPVALAALALDAALGWPPRLHALTGHPVGAFARLITGCERRWNRPSFRPATRRALGVLTVLLLAGTTILAAAALETALRPLGWPVIALCAWPALAQRSLDDHVRPIIAALRNDDLAAARLAVGRIVGRDTATLDRAGIARAAIESLAESFCDGVAAPLFWLCIGGLPGVWAYKAINTADSLIGHPEPPLRAFGWAAARTDDALNLVPARLAALLLCLAGGGGWRIGWRYRHCHASPNAGWPEAAMAGVLGVRLGGPLAYDGQLVAKPWIGEGSAPGLGALIAARRVYFRACGLMWGMAGVIAWLG